MAVSHSQVELQGAGGPISQARGTAILDRLQRESGASDLLQKYLVFEQSLSAGSPLVLGNKVTLLENGPPTHEAMFAAIRGAEHHINLETYIFDDGELGQQFSTELIEKQQAGVQVNVIYDSVGGLLTPQAFFDRLRDSGVNVVEFNPVNPLTANRKTWLLNNRDHRKQLVVDGRIAFIGGVNISDSYASRPSGKRFRKRLARDIDAGWRDTHIQIEGPVVAEFQKLFMDTWKRQKGTPLGSETYFPELPAVGEEIVRAMGSRAEDPESPIYMALVSVLENAQHEAHLTVAYFAPDPQLLKALVGAARRGVDVKLVLPSFTDSWPIFNLGRSYYSTLLRAGVKLFERHGAVMHAKTAVIDGVWCTIGSSNLDWRSYLHNDEVNAMILGRTFADEVRAMFDADLKESEQILLKRWRRRSPWMRLKERLARLGAYWL